MEWKTIEQKTLGKSNDPSLGESSESLRNPKVMGEVLERVLTSHEGIGSGKTAYIFVDTEHKNICFKILRQKQDPNLIVNDIEREKDLTTKARLLSTDVRIPIPQFWIRGEITVDNQEKEMQILCIERIKGYTLKDIMSARNGNGGVQYFGLSETSTDLQEKYLSTVQDVRLFFRRITSFVEKMNQEAGIFHNDLHEGNIMINEEGEPVIIDFGNSTEEPFSDDRIGKNVDINMLRQTRVHLEKFVAGKQKLTNT